MLGTAVLLIIIFIIVLIFFVEYRNEKRYQEKRRQDQQRPTRQRRQTTTPTPPKPPLESGQARTVEPKPEPIPQSEKKVEPQSEPEPRLEIKTEPITQPEKAPLETPEKSKELPEANYPPFSHVRLVEMGLSDDEAKEFVTELIPQLEEQIPLIEEALNIPDFHQMERLTHSIKGSATNIGTGGISDLLTDCNTYLKTGTDIDVARAYFEHLKYYTKELKSQYT